MQYPIIPLFGGLGTYYTPKICLNLLLVQINHHLAKNSLIVATGSVNIIDTPSGRPVSVGKRTAFPGPHYGTD